MIILLSPSKTLDMDSKVTCKNTTTPALLDHSKTLVSIARKLSSKDIQKLMGVSEKIARLNEERFAKFRTPFTTDNAKPAIYTFKGDVYDGLNSESLSTKDIRYAQSHLRILSGLYGLLKPLDLMQAYRLEMGIKLANPKGKNLYEFWGEIITEQINEALDTSKSEFVVNLASNEYYSAVKPKSLIKPVITPVFKEKKGTEYKVIGIHAKKARGRMAAFMLQHQIHTPDAIKTYTQDGYCFNPAQSDEKSFVFTRSMT